MTTNNKFYTLNVTSVEEQPDGSAIVNFEFDDEFKEEFKNLFNLKRWSNKRFKKEVMAALRALVDGDKNNES